METTTLLRRNQRNPPFALRIERSLYRKILEAAKRKRISMADFLRLAAIEALRKNNIAV